MRAPALGESSPKDKPDKEADDYAQHTGKGYRARVNMLQEHRRDSQAHGS